MVQAPLFPRYLFVAIDVTAQRWRSIHSTIGVTRLVCRGDEPVAAAPGVVEALRQREDDNGLIRLERKLFAAGDKVRVLEGAFADCLGLYEGINDAQRVAILLDLLGRKVRVVLKTDWVEAA
jgi:transcriptional antiterminator RfaH